MLFAQLGEAWRRLGTLDPNARSVNRLTRSARDRARAAGETVSRRHLDYVAKTALNVDADGQPLNADELAHHFADFTTQRMIGLRIIGERDLKQRAQVHRWLGIK